MLIETSRNHVSDNCTEENTVWFLWLIGVYLTAFTHIQILRIL